MRPQIKHIAVYRIKPLQAITHIAPVSSIEPYKDSGKYIVNFAEPAREIASIPLATNRRIKHLQSLRYTTLERLQSAKTIDDVS